MEAQDSGAQASAQPEPPGHTQHLARQWHRSTKHHLELGEAMMMHGVFELFFFSPQNLFILGSALWPFPDLGCLWL